MKNNEDTISWEKIRRAAWDNPDLPIDFIRDMLISLEEIQDPSLLEPFIPESEGE